jgi:hypothetical protein
MNIYQSIKRIELEKSKQELCDKIRHLGLKVLDAGSSNYTEDSNRASRYQLITDPHSCVRPIFTDSYITPWFNNRV